MMPNKKLNDLLKEAENILENLTFPEEELPEKLDKLLEIMKSVGEIDEKAARELQKRTGKILSPAKIIERLLGVPEKEAREMTDVFIKEIKKKGKSESEKEINEFVDEFIESDEFLGLLNEEEEKKELLDKELLDEVYEKSSDEYFKKGLGPNFKEIFRKIFKVISYLYLPSAIKAIKAHKKEKGMKKKAVKGIKDLQRKSEIKDLNERKVKIEKRKSFIPKSIKSKIKEAKKDRPKSLPVGFKPKM